MRPYDETVERTRAALKEQGFGVLTEIDVRNADLGLGLLLPCNVIVYDNGDGSSTAYSTDWSSSDSTAASTRPQAEATPWQAAFRRAPVGGLSYYWLPIESCAS